jgi:hypothetical protein
MTMKIEDKLFLDRLEVSQMTIGMTTRAFISIVMLERTQ